MRKFYSKVKYIIFKYDAKFHESNVKAKVDISLELLPINRIGKYYKKEIFKLQSRTFFYYLKYYYGKKGTKVMLAWEGSKLAHVTWILPVANCIKKYGFLPHQDFIIGPCTTSPEYKGKNIFPHVIMSILNRYSATSTFWIFSNENNIPSIKGIKKTTAKEVGIFVHKRYLWGMFSLKNILLSKK